MIGDRVAVQFGQKVIFVSFVFLMCATTAASACPPPPCPPEFGIGFDLVRDGVKAQAAVKTAVPCLSGDCLHTEWQVAIGGKWKVFGPPKDWIDPKQFDPFVTAKLEGSFAPYNNPYFSISGGAEVSAPLSDFQKRGGLRPGLFLEARLDGSALERNPIMLHHSLRRRRGF